MRPILTVFPIAVILCACASVDTQPMDDLSLEKRLQHTWSFHGVGSNHAIVDGETTYLPGGVMNLFGHTTQDGTVHTDLGSGTWYVKNGYLYYTLAKSNFSREIPNGFTSADKIVRVTETEFTYISSHNGRTITEHRIR